MTLRSTTRGDVATAFLSFLVGSLLSLPALADDPPKAPDAPAATGSPTPAQADTEKLKELEQKVYVLTKEIESIRLGETPAQQAPPPSGAAAAAAPPSTPTLGLGPSASKVYAKYGVSIGGYGETIFQDFSTARQDGTPSNLTPIVDVARAVLYFGYKFDDHFVFNSELEFEHAVTASDKDGEAEIEFAYMDWLSRSKAFNLRAGLMLVPVGLINQLHEPPVFLGSLRPDVETVILPSTWREIGAGGWGDVGPFSWRLYFVNGLDASRYAADGLKEGSGEGSLALARSFAVTGRLDYTGVPGVLVGGSFFSGNSGQGQVTPSGASFAGRTTFVDLHLDARYRGAQFRAVWARSTVGDAAAIDQLNNLGGDESVGSRQEGWYAEAGFDVLSLVPKSRMSLIPFVRYETYDTQAAVPVGYARDPGNDVRVVTVGANFKPIPQVVIKADGQWRRNAARTGVKQLNIALGYEF